MYNEHFGFRESPFSAAPSSRFFYINDQYKEALANLRYGIEWKKGLIVMTGEVGTGKTTLLGKAMRSLEATTHPVFVSYNHLTYAELLRLISKELGLAGDGQDRFETVEQLRECLAAQHKQGHIVALLIDEAQRLSDEMFEDIRFLSNFEDQEEKLLQIVLTGQPELERRLDEINLRNIKQRVVVHCRLAPLKDDEVGRYIETRLEQAGYDGKDLFDRDAVDQIALYSGGVPRLINIVCDNALLLAYAQSEKKVTAEMIQEAARDLGLTGHLPKQSAHLPTAIETNGDSIVSSNLRDSAQLAGSEGQPFHRHTSRLTRIAARITLGVVVLASAAGAFYWSQATDWLRHAPTSEPRSLVAENLKNELSRSMPPAKSVTAREAIGKDFNWRPDKLKAIGPKAERLKTENRPIAAKQDESSLGNFEVTGPSSFLRNSPQSDAKIIATLESGTGVKVLGKRGNYFRVQAIVDGQRLRGYVHREDAFFERIKKSDGRQETPLQIKSARRANPERELSGTQPSKPADKNPPQP